MKGWEQELDALYWGVIFDLMEFKFRPLLMVDQNSNRDKYYREIGNYKQTEQEARELADKLNTATGQIFNVERKKTNINPGGK